MGNAKKIVRTLLIAASFVTLLCQSVTAKGVNTNYTQVNGEVARGARSKYTKLRGKNRDTVTLMIYMIGTDLESNTGMATDDLNEMLYAGLDNPNLNVLIQTGGCRHWRNSVISAGKQQRWALSSQGIALLDEKKETVSMTDEGELSDFIRFCARTAPADRYMLIFWDHGGGSVSGYGYDETRPNDSMNLVEISRALDDAGVLFDFIGFDACLMGTLETAIAMEPYADYLIASEEAEPGTGWYYTNWLKLLNQSSSTNTLNLGRQICDDFTTKNAMYASSTGTTLSVVDLAELGGTVAEKLGQFGSGLTGQLQSNQYQEVAYARNGSREFSPANRLDQVDLVDFCLNLNTKESKSLAQAVQSAVKYNRVNGITNAYGLSIYFPNSSLKSVNSMIQICEEIGVDSEWTEGIRAYATLEQSGQIVANNGYSYGSGSGSLLDVLLGSGSSGSGSYSNDSGSSVLDYLLGSGGSAPQTYNSYDSMSEDDIYNMLMQSFGSGQSTGNAYGSGSYGNNAYGNSSYSSGSYDFMDLLTGGYQSTSGSYYGINDYSSIYGNDNTDTSSGYGFLDLAAQMLFGRAMVGSQPLELTEKNGEKVLVLSEEMWEQITDAELNVFVDDGEGYLDLGIDNVLDYTEDGDLIDEWDGTWLTISGQPVALYPISDEDVDDNGLYITTKFSPVLLNGERVNLILEFNEETGIDSVLGVQDVLPTGVQAKGYRSLEPGDVIQPVCDYFTYDGTFAAQYTLGDPFIVPDDAVLPVVNKTITGGRMLYTARLTDIYQANYWLPMTEYK